MLDKFDKKNNPFTVPNNYFAGLTKDVMNNLPAKEMKQVKKVTLWKKVLPWASVAAVVVAVAIAVNMMGNMPKMLAEEPSDNEVKEQAQLAYNEVEDYFLFLEDESTEAMYIDVLLEDEK